MSTQQELLALARQQPISLTLIDNTTISFTAGDIDEFALYNVQICISYATQLGASAMLLVVVALCTKPDRRKTMMFGLNTMALFLNIIRNLLLMLYFTSTWSEAYVFFTSSWDLVPTRDYATSCTSSLMSLLMLIVVEACLVLQTQVVLITLPKLQRQAILAASMAIATTAVALRVAYTVVSIKTIMAKTADSSFDHFTDVVNIFTTVSICWFSVIFTAKLGVAILNRRKMGIQTFGPMDILFIMGGQTMIIPAIISILWFATNVPSFSSWVLTITAIFLPLSSLWASSIIEGRRASNNHNTPRNGSHTLGGSTFVSTSGGSSKYGGKLKGLAQLGKKFGARRSSDWSAVSPIASVDESMEMRSKRVLVDLEKQGM